MKKITEGHVQRTLQALKYISKGHFSAGYMLKKIGDHGFFV